MDGTDIYGKDDPHDQIHSFSLFDSPESIEVYVINGRVISVILEGITNQPAIQVCATFIPKDARKIKTNLGNAYISTSIATQFPDINNADVYGNWSSDATPKAGMFYLYGTDPTDAARGSCGITLGG